MRFLPSVPGALWALALYTVSQLQGCICSSDTYSNSWAVRIEGGHQTARDIVEKHGFTFMGQILRDHYHIHHRKVVRRSALPSAGHAETLSNDPQVSWLEQQVVKRRVKRGRYLELNDPDWTYMWYMRESPQRRINLNVEGAWRLGYTGKGVVVTILDDGIETTHPDLEDNYEPSASLDINGNDKDPTPRYDPRNENKHGTRCAGQVAAVANNSVCNVGVAYNARIGGIRMLDGDVTDAVEAISLSYNKDFIDVYSASWGPDDDGKTVDGPASMAQRAFIDGVQMGRSGLGSIFVWASGNGGHHRDSCNCDGYANSIYTLSISSTTENGATPWYSEACSSTLATTYSSGSHHEKMIYTTDLRKQCTHEHTGTSASAPFAAGIVALALQANPSLTWRDMQYLVVLTSNSTGINADDWRRNGVGRMVSHHYGYGLMDAEAMVLLARNWTAAPDQHVCTQAVVKKEMRILPNGRIAVRINTDGCAKDPKRRVRLLEHVQAKMSISSQRRGELRITLTSPAGTKSVLLAKRDRDHSKMGFTDWPFMTTHSWGEPASGTWYLEIENGYRTDATLKELTMIFHGVSNNSADGDSNEPIYPSANRCPSPLYLHRNQCVGYCPPGHFNYYDPNLQYHLVCAACHWSCADCSDRYSHTCTACRPPDGSPGKVLPRRGRCLSASTGAQSQDGEASGTLWWLTFGAAVGLCLLVAFLVILSVYYGWTQGYVCTGSSREKSVCWRQASRDSSQPCSSATGSTSVSSALGEDERTKMSHSSQSELVSSDEECEAGMACRRRLYAHPI